MRISDWSSDVCSSDLLNLRLRDGIWQGCIVDILRAGTAYGASTIGAGRRVNVEYVSANPTGPLHVAPARGAVIGAALAALLAQARSEERRGGNECGSTCR